MNSQNTSKRRSVKLSGKEIHDSNALEIRWIEQIRNRLFEYKEKKGLSYTKIRKSIAALCGIEISEQAIRRALGADSKSPQTPNLIHLLAICRAMNLNVAQAMAFPGDDIIDIKENALPYNTFEYFSEPAYMGSYYGYCCTVRESQDNDISKFTLSIEYLGDKSYCVLEYENRYLDLENQQNAVKLLSYRGSAIFSRAINTVYIRMTDERGFFAFLFFNYQVFSSGNLWFRRGLMVIPSSLAGHPPIAMTFVLFREDVMEKEGTRKYIKGLLKSPTSTFHIPVEDLEKLIDADNESVKMFWEKYGDLIKNRRIDVYELDDSFIKEKPTRFDLDEEVAAEAIILMRGESIEDPQRIYHDQNPYAHYVMHHILSDNE